ncbi:MAG: DUF3592 domain-containing protein [Rhodobacteraceae bacterium]|nr:DUF3592 domain-containing protein [Paracoccaceae bacterium]
MPPPSAATRPALTRGIYTRRTAFWLGTIAAALALVFCAVGGWYGVEAVALDRAGVTTTGTVTARRVSTQRQRHGGTTHSYHLEVGFRDASGAALEDEFTVSHSFYQRSGIGRSVNVRYVPDRPWIAEIEPGRDWRQAQVFGGIGLAFLLGGLVSLAITARQASSRRRALLEGAERTATVVAVRRSGRARSRSTRLQWRDSEGSTGSSVNIRPERLPAVGDTITVFVDPRSGKAYWQGDY